MTAVQVSKTGAGFELVERDIPAPKENEVLIRVQACGICHGDALALEGMVAVAGIGGLGHLAIHYARKIGCKTIALSRGLPAP